MEKKKTLSRTENVYRYIKDEIIYGGIQPGELLNEGILAEQLEVSKTPVREALNGLKYEGLVDVIPYKGYFVKNLSLKEIKDLFEVRIFLESKAAELATLRATEEQISMLRELATREIDTELNNSKKSFLQINENFHTFIGLMTGNDRINDLVRTTINHLQPALFHDIKESNLTRMTEEHLALVQAIENRNAKLAKEIMHQQLQESQKRIIVLK